MEKLQVKKNEQLLSSRFYDKGFNYTTLYTGIDIHYHYKLNDRFGLFGQSQLMKLISVHNNTGSTVSVAVGCKYFFEN